MKNIIVCCILTAALGLFTACSTQDTTNHPTQAHITNSAPVNMIPSPRTGVANTSSAPVPNNIAK